jgi:P-type Ca2+ transporter type 2C
MPSGTESWHEQSFEGLFKALGTSAGSGLPDEEAMRRRGIYGSNEIASSSRQTTGEIFIRQFRSVMVGLLFFAAVAAGALGDFKDTLAILVMILLNAALGFRQEYHAERAIESLHRLAVPGARVRRSGVVIEVPSVEVVPGDLILLEAGTLVPADARVIASHSLRTQEAALTGESQPVEKDALTSLSRETPLPERSNMVYHGTAVVNGRGEAVVIAIGNNTELGRVAELLGQLPEQPTPLQVQVSRLGRALAAVAVLIGVAVFAAGLWRGEEMRLLLLTSVSLAVAAAPEGLPAVITIALALGSRRMLRRNALVRKLTAVETLGSVTVICTDKTGTLTQNRMSAVAEVVGGGKHVLAGQPSGDPDLRLLLLGAALCNDATVQLDRDGCESWHGDPTEVALAQEAAHRGLDTHVLAENFPRVAEIPFDSGRKRMTTVHRTGVAGEFCRPGEYVAFTKGAVDSLLPVCRYEWKDGRSMLLDQRPVLDDVETFSKAGMRVLGVAFRKVARLPERLEELEKDSTFVGFIALEDPVREEARAAVTTCRAAGIRPVMISGDHSLTACHVARSLGFPGGRVLTGPELDRFSAGELREAVHDTSVYARVTPQHKLAIVEALQERGHVVAMTGDGVNDAPALKKADIGVAMGDSGTEVARQAADMVLRDDNFATIVAAISEGRVVHDNLRKFIRYILSCNAAELWVVLLGPLLGMPLPLLPLQILWMNFVTDGLPAVALTLEPGERNVMERPPRPPRANLLNWGDLRAMLLSSFLVASSVLAVGYGMWARGDQAWQTAIFTIVTVSQVFLALGYRSQNQNAFSAGTRSNKMLIWSVGGVVLLQALMPVVPIARAVFGLAPLSWQALAFCIAVSAIPLGGVEVEKWIQNRRRATQLKRAVARDNLS